MTDMEALRATVRETNDKYDDMLHLALPRHHEKLRKEWTDAIMEAIKPVIEADEALLARVLGRWDECLPSIRGAEGMAYVHGWRYSGPEGGMAPVLDEVKERLR